MKRSTFTIVLASAATSLSLALGAPVRAEEYPVAGLIVGVGDVIEAGPPLIITPSLHLVARPWHVAYEITEGDFAPEILVSSTFIIDIQTGEGILFGEVDWADPDNPGSGFRGPFTGRVSGAFAPGLGGFDGKWTLHGYGVHQAKTAHIANHGPFSAAQVYAGVIRVPNGR